jgi:hypothetical protein
MGACVAEAAGVGAQADSTTNAGVGSNLTAAGDVEGDASIMEAPGSAYGAVGAVPGLTGMPGARGPHRPPTLTSSHTLFPSLTLGWTRAVPV